MRLIVLREHEEKEGKCKLVEESWRQFLETCENESCIEFEERRIIITGLHGYSRNFVKCHLFMKLKESIILSEASLI